MKGKYECKCGISPCHTIMVMPLDIPSVHRLGIVTFDEQGKFYGLVVLSLDDAHKFAADIEAAARLLESLKEA